MTSEADAQLPIMTTKESHEFLFHPVRHFARIYDDDWNRWILALRELAEHDQGPAFKEASFASGGISIPCLVSAAVTMPTVSGLPSWVSVLWLIVGVGTLVAAILCYLFDRNMTGMVRVSTESVLRDMEGVHASTAHAVERIAAKVSAPWAPPQSSRGENVVTGI